MTKGSGTSGIFRFFAAPLSSMSVDTRVESISRTAEHSIGTSSIQMTLSLELEHVDEEELVELELGLLGPPLGTCTLVEPLPLFGQCKLKLELGLLSSTKGEFEGAAVTSALVAGPGPIEGPSESSSFGSIGGTYDEDSEDAASTSSDRVMFCMITDGTSSSGRLAMSASLITIPSPMSLM